MYSITISLHAMCRLSLSVYMLCVGYHYQSICYVSSITISLHAMCRLSLSVCMLCVGYHYQSTSQIIEVTEISETLTIDTCLMRYNILWIIDADSSTLNSIYSILLLCWTVLSSIIFTPALTLIPISILILQVWTAWSVYCRRCPSTGRKIQDPLMKR